MATHRRPATEQEAKALASTVRVRILRLCLDRALTNKEIADRLGAHPATVLHHVRKLVDTGFLTPQPPRRGARGAREIPYLATGKSWHLDIDTLAADRNVLIEAFLQEVAQVTDARQIITSRLGLRLDQAEYAELRRRLDELLDEFAQRPRSPTGQPYSLFIALHPDPSRD